MGMGLPRENELVQWFDAEAADFDRVMAAVDRVDAAGMAELRDQQWLVGIIREIGLSMRVDTEANYADESDHSNGSHQGMIQYPQEYAGYLLRLSELGIRSYLEIGTFNGASACLAAAYLRRFDPDFQLTTVDSNPMFLFHERIGGRLPLRYLARRTSYDVRGEEYDAVFIDGDHSFYWAWADYQNAGRRARVCAFHDIHNAEYEGMRLGGVPGVWAVLAREHRSKPGWRVEEISHHPHGNMMGIGMLVREK